MTIVKAKDIILNQIRIEVFIGHNAIAVYMALSDHSMTLNALPFHQTLGTMQRHALDAFILSLCKLYEKPNSRYPNFSIPATIQMLQANLSDLPGRVQNLAPLEAFATAHISATPNNISRLPALVLDYFAEQCPRTPPRDGVKLDCVLDALKVLRNKRVAHHEDAQLSSLSKTDLDGCLQLLAFAQTYVNIVGYNFFGFSKEGEVDVSRFAPDKSVIWPELNKLIALIEEQKSG